MRIVEALTGTIEMTSLFRARPGYGAGTMRAANGQPGAGNGLIPARRR
ncbi:hypothetical protein [Kitasatospora sp. NPDC056531]